MDDKKEQELLKKFENEVAFELDDKCWEALQILYKKINFLERELADQREINKSHQNYNAELRAKIDILIGDKRDLLDLINKAKWTITADRMEQLDDYVIYLQTKYLEILGEDNG